MMFSNKMSGRKTNKNKNFILIGIFFLYMHQFCEFLEERLVFPQFKQYEMYHCVR